MSPFDLDYLPRRVPGVSHSHTGVIREAAATPLAWCDACEALTPVVTIGSAWCADRSCEACGGEVR